MKRRDLKPDGPYKCQLTSCLTIMLLENVKLHIINNRFDLDLKLKLKF